MDDTLIISTPEQVSLEYDLAGGGSRFIAFVIDALLLGLLLFLLSLFLVLAGFEKQAAVFAMAAFLLHVAYHLFFEIAREGGSPGKNLVQIRVIGEGGMPLTWKAVLVRSLLRPVDFMPAFYLLGMASILWTIKNQRLGDLAARTVVIRTRNIQPGDLRDPFGNRTYTGLERHEFLFHSIAKDRLESRDLWVLKEYFLRKGRLDPAARDRLLASLCANYARKTGLGAPREKRERFLFELYLFLRDQA